MEIKYNIEVEPYCCEVALLQDALDTLGYIYKQKSENYASIAILCHEDLTEVIIKSLNIMCANSDIDLDIEYLNFDKADYGYEYGIILVMEDGQLTLSVETAMCKDGNYKLFDLDYIYASDECDDELIAKHAKYDMDIFCITSECEEDDFENDEFECDGDCENCDLNEDEFEEETIDLYDLVEDIVEIILEEKFTI